jgi:flavin-dependent dehydrogenase
LVYRSADQNYTVIIGTSTAGLFAAYLLAKEGIPVRIFDQGETLGPPARTLIVTGQIKQVLGFVPSEAILNRIATIQLFSRCSSATVHLREADLVLERERLVQLLAEKAREVGAHIELAHRFLGFEVDKNGIMVSLLDLQRDRVEQLPATFLVGADGVFSQVARAAKLDHRASVPILQAKVTLPPDSSHDTTRVCFNRQETRYFYWLIPESAERGMVGLIADEPEEAHRSLERFLDEHRLQPLDFQAAQVALYRRTPMPLRRVGQGVIFCIGDAAGQVKVTTVGGVVTGLRAARAVAQAILRQTDYEADLRDLRRELNLHLLIRSVLNRFTDADYDELLRLLNQQSQHILGAYTRDEISRSFWRLALAQPRGLLLGIKAIFRKG